MYHLSCQGWINKLKLFSNKTLFSEILEYIMTNNVESSVSVYNAVITNLREGLTHMEAYINEGVRVWIGVFELKNEMISFTQNEMVLIYYLMFTVLLYHHIIFFID